MGRMVEGKMMEQNPLAFPIRKGMNLHWHVRNKNLKDHCWSQFAFTDWQHSVPSL